MVSAKTICGSKPDMNVFEQMSCATRPVTTRNARSRPTPINTAAEITRTDKSQISFRNIRFVSPRSVRNECRVDPLRPLPGLSKQRIGQEEPACGARVLTAFLCQLTER